MKQFLLLLFVSPIIIAQNIKETKKRKTNEVYHVIRDNREIKQGKYVLYFEIPKWKKKEVVGYYTQNKKDSIWQYYDWNGNLIKKGRFENDKRSGEWSVYLWNPQIISSKGVYKEDKKIGIWEYFNEHGILIHRFDHTRGKLLYYTKNESTLTDQPNDLNTEENNAGMILGGEAGFRKYISREFIYPKDAQWNGVSGLVLVNFYVNEKFEKSNFRVQHDPGYGVGDEAIRLIRNGPLWIPPEKDGRYSGSKFSVPITTYIY